MKEEFLHYIWKTKSFRLDGLKTTIGKEVEVVNFGTHNMNAGPDFLNARIVIEDQIWIGHVEIHVTASDWLKHNHSKDDAYQNVILHVVLIWDIDIKRKDGTIIPCISIKDRISASLLANYPLMLNKNLWIPCEKMLQSVALITKQQTISIMLAGRLSFKAKSIESAFVKKKVDWDEVAYKTLCQSMGLSVNAGAMVNIAARTPWQVISEMRHDVFQLEALFFGQSGLIETQEDNYSKKLSKCYNHLRKRYQLTPGKAVEWKFSRMRPQNFPTLRIAQFVQILHQCQSLSNLAIHQSLEEIYDGLNIEVGGYWLNHYRFGKVAPKKKKRLGKATIHRIITNAIIPIRFFYAQKHHLADKQESCVSILEQLPSERNQITERWIQLNLPNKSAADSQGLIELKKTFCDKQRCLSCPIGHKILTRKNDSKCTG